MRNAINILKNATIDNILPDPRSFIVFARASNIKDLVSRS